MEEKLLTTAEVAQYCDMSIRCINKAVQKGRLHEAPESTDNKHLFTASEVKRFQESRLEKAKNKNNNNTVQRVPLCNSLIISTLNSRLTPNCRC